MTCKDCGCHVPIQDNGINCLKCFGDTLNVNLKQWLPYKVLTERLTMGTAQIMDLGVMTPRTYPRYSRDQIKVYVPFFVRQEYSSLLFGLQRSH